MNMQKLRHYLALGALGLSALAYGSPPVKLYALTPSDSGGYSFNHGTLPVNASEAVRLRFLLINMGMATYLNDSMKVQVAVPPTHLQFYPAQDTLRIVHLPTPERARLDTAKRDEMRRDYCCPGQWGSTWVHLDYILGPRGTVPPGTRDSMVVELRPALEERPQGPIRTHVFHFQFPSAAGPAPLRKDKATAPSAPSRNSAGPGRLHLWNPGAGNGAAQIRFERREKPVDAKGSTLPSPAP